MVPGCPRIAPLDAALARRPRWSVVIPTYNCADYLRECLTSVLAQALPTDEMEIVVVDDRSEDRPEDVVAEIGRGRVWFVRHDSNLGAVANFNACLDRSTGELVHLLHGDDLVRPGFYERAQQVFADDLDVGMFVSRVTYIDDSGTPGETTRSERDGSGRWERALDAMTVSNRVRPPGAVVRRTLYEQHGGFRTDLPHAADWEMWVRLAAAAPVWFEDDSLALYRRHGNSDTAARVLSGANISERLACIDVVASHLPVAVRRRQQRRAYAYSALFAARTAGRLILARELRGAANQATGGVRALGHALAPG